MTDPTLIAQADAAEPATAAPATAAPATAAPATTAPATAVPATVEPVAVEPVAVEPETAEKIAENVTETLSPIVAHLQELYTILYYQLFSYQGPMQLAVTAAVAVASFLLRDYAKLVFDHIWREEKFPVFDRLRRVLRGLMPFAACIIGLWIATLVLTGFSINHYVVRIAASLLNAWIFIRIFSSAVSDPFWSKAFAIGMWLIAALSIMRLLNPTIAMLDSIGTTIGGTKVTAYLVLKGGLTAAILLWTASAGSKVLQARVSSSRNLTPSVQVLISQLGRFTLLFLAVVIALNVVGIDLTALAVFSGAVGVGIGFGLQKIVSNLISGIILLMDRSIKPGDVVELVGTYGWVASLGARYTSVRTRDGTEHLIPNEEFIINRVVNWTHSDKTVRRKVMVGVHYDSDVPKAMELMLEATQGIKRIVAIPAPTVLLRNFGDSSVDLETRFWISDPANGVSNVASEYLLAVWREFHKHGIEIPYPQRDLHLKTSAPLSLEQSADKDGPTPIASFNENADPDIVEDIRLIAMEDERILRINEVVTVPTSSDEILLNLSLDFTDTLDSVQVEQAVSDLETSIKASHPNIGRIFIEAQNWRAHLADKSRTSTKASKTKKR